MSKRLGTSRAKGLAVELRDMVLESAKRQEAMQEKQRKDTLAQTTLGQMVIRVALQCNEADARSRDRLKRGLVARVGVIC